MDVAKKIFIEIKQECNKLYTLPERKRVVPEFQEIGIIKYREIIYKRWRIVYKIDDEKVYVLLVADSSRNLEDILFQRLIKSDNKIEWPINYLAAIYWLSSVVMHSQKLILNFTI